MADYQGQLFVRSLAPSNDTLQNDLLVGNYLYDLANTTWKQSIAFINADGGSEAALEYGNVAASILYGFNSTDSTYDRLATDEAVASKQGVLRTNIHDGSLSTEVAAHGAPGKTNAFQLLGFYTSDPTANNKVNDGDAVRLLTDSEGRVYVKISDPQAGSLVVHDYASATITAGATDNTSFSYTVDLTTNSAYDKFLIEQILVSSTGHMKATLKVGGVAKATIFNSPAYPTANFEPVNLETDVDTTVILVEVTSLEHTDTDAYVTIVGKYIEG